MCGGSTPIRAGNFVPLALEKLASGSTAPSTLSRADIPSCPAEISETLFRTALSKSSKPQSVWVCRNYEKGVDIGFMPSSEFCPDCQYNPNNLKI